MLVDVAMIVLCLLIAGSLFSWLFRRLGLSDVVGYILGGAVASAVLTWFGVDIASSLSYGESLRWLGLTLFSFTLGNSIGFHRIVEDIRSVVASELILYAVLWVFSGFLAWLLGFGYVERTALFLLLINSSSVAVAALSKSFPNTSSPLYARAVVQTSTEDLLQFTFFTLLFVAGVSLSKTPLEAFTHIIIIAGLTVLLLSFSRLMLRFLSRTRFIADKENKFVVSIGFAILFASMASAAGLPALFGAFIAGASFSAFLKLDDVADMINGLRGLGLLLYFTSLGSQLYLGISSMQSLDTVLIGIVLGLAAYMVRAIGLFIATLFTVYRISDSIALALYLTPLSEMGVVFADALVERGVLPESTAAMFIVAVLTTITLFGIATPRIAVKTAYFEKIAPARIASFFKNLADIYSGRVDMAAIMLTPIIKFTATALAFTYINSLVVSAVERFNLSSDIAMASTIISSAAVMMAFIKTLRTLFNNILKHIAASAERLGEALGKALDLLIGGFALAFQIHILFETSSKVFPGEPLYTLATLFTWLAIVIVIVLELIRYYTKSYLPHHK